MCLDRCSEPYQLPEHILHAVRDYRMAPRLELRIDPCALGGGRAIPPRLDLDPEPDPPAGVPDIEVGDPRGHHRPLGLAGAGDVTAERLERPDDLPLDPLLGGSSHLSLCPVLPSMIASTNDTMSLTAIMAPAPPGIPSIPSQLCPCTSGRNWDGVSYWYIIIYIYR